MHTQRFPWNNTECQSEPHSRAKAAQSFWAVLLKLAACRCVLPSLMSDYLPRDPKMYSPVPPFCHETLGSAKGRLPRTKQ
jgi:hypothetical protein